MVNCMEKMLRNKAVICSFLFPALLLFTVTVILPIGWSVYYSFFNWNGVSKMKFIGIDNYIRMFADNNFKTAFLNNILFLVANVLGQVGTGLLLALMLTHIDKGRNLLKTFYFVPTILSAVALSQFFTKFFSYEPLGVFNALLDLLHFGDAKRAWLGDSATAMGAVILIECYKSMPLYMVILYSGLISIPDNIIEAAKMDGAQGIKMFVYIKLPYLVNVLTVALVMAVNKLMQDGLLDENPIVSQVAAVSAGIVEDEPLLDLCYTEDSRAQTDMNFVMNHRGEFIELQGTGEGRAFTNRELHCLLDAGRAGVRRLMKAQREALRGIGGHLLPPPMVVVASGNAHKLQELTALFRGVCQPVSMKEVGFEGDIDENGSTFEENARIKAECVMKATGLPTLADDSGLSVDALGGAPGIYSARYAGEHGNDRANNELLLKNMDGVADRTCRFVCAMALALPGQETRIVRGECEGTLLTALEGEGGFGYDPLFLYQNGQTFAQMSPEEKNQVSHRFHAVDQMRDVLRALF